MAWQCWSYPRAERSHGKAPLPDRCSQERQEFPVQSARNRGFEKLGKAPCLGNISCLAVSGVFGAFPDTPQKRQEKLCPLRLKSLSGRDLAPSVVTIWILENTWSAG